MSTELLQTKFNIPSAGAILVSRPHLLKKLNAGLSRKLVLVSAPAGFGKTTLLAHWVEGLRLQVEGPQASQKGLRSTSLQPSGVAWLSLDGGDNDPGRFWSYLTTALQNVDQYIGKNSQGVLRAPKSTSSESFLTSLINAISSSSRQIVLVLDDYHLITASKIHQAMAFFLDHLPANLHLVISTRTDPPIPLPRLRARDQILELRAADLRFTGEEIGSFFLQRAGLELPEADLRALESRTEGWVAGLQLAALAIGRQEDASRFIHNFAGDNRYIVDYLAQEILEALPAEDRDFLLKTSILEGMCASLCEHVTGEKKSRETLERLESANLFLMPVDGARTWYRYHHLFADFLRHQLEATQGEILPELHRRASSWYEARDFSAQAVEHALSARDYERAAQLIEDSSQATFMMGEYTTLLDWLDALPAEIVRQRARLCLAYAWTSLMAGNLSDVEPHLNALENLISASVSDPGRGKQDRSETQIYSAHILSIRAELACSLGKVSEAAAYSRRALELLPEEESFLRGMNAINMTLNIAEADISHTDVESTSAILLEASQASRAAGDLQSAFYSLGLLGTLQFAQGKLKGAARILEGGLNFIALKQQPIPVMGLIYVAMGTLQYEWNDLEASHHYLQTGVKFGKEGDDLRPLAAGYTGLSRLSLAQGDTQAAREYIRMAEQAVMGSEIGWVTSPVRAAQVKLWLALGNLDTAWRWAQQSGLEIGDPIGYNRQGEYLALASVYLARGAYDQALALLDWLQGVMQRVGLIGVVIEIQALRALIFKAMNERLSALNALKEAVILAQPEGYVRTFVDLGGGMRALIEDEARVLSSESSRAGFLDRLLSSFPPSAPTTKSNINLQKSAMVEPLTAREVEVMNLIAEGFTNKDIADALVIAPGTVKRHAHNIYTKLNVSNRTEAVAKARELELFGE